MTSYRKALRKNCSRIWKYRQLCRRKWRKLIQTISLSRCRPTRELILDMFRYCRFIMLSKNIFSERMKFRILKPWPIKGSKNLISDTSKIKRINEDTTNEHYQIKNGHEKLATGKVLKNLLKKYFIFKINYIDEDVIDAVFPSRINEIKS